MTDSPPTPDDLPPLPPDVARFVADCVTALRISLSTGHSVKKLTISTAMYPQGSMRVEESWPRPKAVTA